MSQIRNIPDYFLQRYQDEFAKWAAYRDEKGRWPSTWLFTFNEGDIAESSPDPEQGKQLLGAWLFGRRSRAGIEIEPYSESDRAAIIKHCERMEAARVPAWAKLREPERPGIPVIPWRH